MKRLFATLILMTIFVLNTDGQKTWITPDIKIKNDFSFELLGRWPSKNLLLFRDKLFTYEVEAYDEQMKPIWSKALNLSDLKLNIIGINHRDTSFTVFYSYKKKSKTFIEYKTFDENLLLLKSDLLFESKKGFDRHSFRFTQSDDLKKVLIFFTKERTNLHLLNYEMDDLKNTSPVLIKMDYRFWKKQLEGIIINNEGNVFIVRDVSDSRRNKDKISLLFHRITKEGSVKRVLLRPTDLYSGDIHFVYDDMSGKMILAGTYGEKNNDWVNGYWMMKTSDSLEEDEFFSYEFSPETLRELNGNIKNVYKGVKELYIEHLMLRKDGGAVIIGEVQKEYSRRPDLNPRINETSFGVRRWVDHYYEDILPISIHPDGKFHWSSVLHKRQYSQDDEAVYSSFFIMKNPAMLKFIFNDEIRNSNTVSEYVVTSRGLLERNSLMNTASLKLQLRMRDATQISSEAILIPSQTDHQLNIVKMVF